MTALTGSEAYTTPMLSSMAEDFMFDVMLTMLAPCHPNTTKKASTRTLLLISIHRRNGSGTVATRMSTTM